MTPVRITKRLNDDGYRLYGALSFITGHPEVVKYLDQTPEGKECLERLYQLRDDPDLFERFRT